MWLLLMCALVYIPLLLVRSFFFDDWAWLWVWWVEGAPALFGYMVDVSHPGYWPVLSTFYAAGEYAGTFARAVAIGCHVTNSVLIYLVLRKMPLTRKISPLAAVIYVLSPFYYARGMLSHAPYDVFLLSYLISIRLSRSSRAAGMALAVVLFVVSLSLETLMFLEPLRIAYVYRRSRGVGEVVRRCAPFWICAGAIAIVRLTLLKPSGPYEGFNAVNLAVVPMLANFARHVRFYFQGVEFILSSAVRQATMPGLLIAAAVAFGCSWMLMRRLPATAQRAETRGSSIWRIAFGGLLAGLGAFPYVLAGRVPFVTHFESRIAYAALVGVSIVIASCVMAIPWRLGRTWATCLLVTVCVLASLRLSKWYLFDELIQRDLIAQLAGVLQEMPDAPPEIRLNMIPDSRDVLVVRRSLSTHELAAPENLLRGTGRPLAFVYDASSFRPPSADQFPRVTCTITSLDRYPCPEALVDLEYRLNSGTSSVDVMSYWTIFRYRFTRTASLPLLGTLTSVGSARTFDTRPSLTPSSPGGHVVARILQLGQ